jgi:hypothetical protein
VSASTVADFIIVQAEGKSWFGKPQAGWCEATYDARVAGIGLTVEPRMPVCILKPIYEYSLLLVPGPQGQPQMQPSLRPPFGLMSVTSLALPGAAIWISVADLADDEQRMFVRLLRDTETALGMARAQAAGLSVVGPGAKMPTSFGGGPRQ